MNTWRRNEASRRCLWKCSACRAVWRAKSPLPLSPRKKWNTLHTVKGPRGWVGGLGQDQSVSLNCLLQYFTLLMLHLCLWPLNCPINSTVVRNHVGHLSMFASIQLWMQLTVLSMCMGSTSARLAPIFILSLWIPSRSSFTRFMGRHLQETQVTFIISLEHNGFLRDVYNKKSAHY